MVDSSTRLDSLKVEARQTPVDIRSYSRFVSAMRIIIPLGIIAVIIALFTWPQLEQSLPDIADTPLQGDINDAENTLINPVFESLDKKRRPYVITAKKAELKGLKNNDIFLDTPMGDFTLSNDRNLNITAKLGVYNQSKQTLYLNEDVNMAHSEGYNLDTQAMFIDLKQSIIKADEAVTIYFGQNILTGASLEIIEQGEHIKIQGPASIKLNPNALDKEK